jgi:hypothetical protein
MYYKHREIMQITFTAVAHLDESFSLEILLTFLVEKYIMYLLATQRPTVSITERQFPLFLKTSKSREFSRRVRPE